MLPVQPVRILLLLLALFFAFFLGRVGARLHRRRLPYTKAVTWVLRLLVALGAIWWTRGLDAIAIAAILLSAGSIAAGIYVEGHPRKPEEIHLFPGDRE